RGRPLPARGGTGLPAPSGEGGRPAAQPAGRPPHAAGRVPPPGRLRPPGRDAEVRTGVRGEAGSWKLEAGILFFPPRGRRAALEASLGACGSKLSFQLPPYLTPSRLPPIFPSCIFSG